MRVLDSRLIQPSGPWANVTKSEQQRLTGNWKDPSWYNAAGIIVFKRTTQNLLDTEVLTSLNSVVEQTERRQIHFGGFMNPNKDFLGPEFSALREMLEETGLLIDIEMATLRTLPEVTTLHAPTRGEVFKRGNSLLLVNSPDGRNAYPHPHTVTIFATDALLKEVGSPDGEVRDVRWRRIGDVIDQYGRDRSFSYPGVIFGFLWWLKTSERFRYRNWPNEKFELQL